MHLGAARLAPVRAIAVALLVMVGLMVAPASAQSDEPTLEPSATTDPSESPEPSTGAGPSESAEPSEETEQSVEPSPSTGSSEPSAPMADQVATTLELTASAARSGEQSTLEVTLRDAEGAPLQDATVTVVRRDGAGTEHVAEVVTGVDGTATASAELQRSVLRNVFVATFTGTDTHTASSSAEVSARLIAWASSISLTMPTYVIDEHAVRLNVKWRTSAGDPVDGRLVQIDRRYGSRWVRQKTLRTDANGAASWLHKVRLDTDWRVRGLGMQWVEDATSSTSRIDNRPRLAPVRLPSSAPRPTVRVPAQPRATRSGADVVITRIPSWVWREMSGVSWRSGCPVGRSSLRLVRVNYWAFDGYRRRGEIVVHTDAARQVGRAFTSMYFRQLPIRSMYRVDRFGYHSTLRGGDDFKSMAADNTSGFNCRTVVNNPGVRSPHSYGRSVDVNPWENPYRSARGYTPNSWWPYRSHPEVAWRNSSHIVVRVMRYYGLSWTYGAGDLHHFDAR